jgi:type I restriction enzyme S subunit
VPPIEEQKRIVEKVDQLMTLCDELEARQEKQTHTLRQLNDASLHALFSASSPKEFEKHWKRIIVNFNLLYGDLENLTKLRQAIFDLAFSGKLSKQWRNKQRNENIAVHSNQNVSAANNLYPVGWRLEPLHTIASVGTGATPLTTNPQYYSAGTINWVTSSSTSLPFVTQPDKLITKTAIQETNCKIFPCGTLIVAMYGQGKTRGQISELQIPAATNQALAAIQLHLLDDYHKRYVKYFFQKIYSEIRKLASGGAQPNLNLNIIKSTLIPIPPPDEQKYIADKIEALLCICDALEEKIKTKSAHLETLTASILAH